jgi:hypothetical protein
MAPVMRVEPNGNQALLMFDNARQVLADSGWLTFVKRFEGFNLFVARQFSMTFDGCRAKVGNVQLEIDEQFIISATGLAPLGQRWFKNCKVEEVSWTLLFQSRKVTLCDRGMPISALKPQWHDTLMVIKQFVTCEGRYGLVFLHHLRLLMIFIGYPLNMPFYFHRSLFKMSKKFKRHQADSSLFHYGLIKIIVVFHLSLLGDTWKAFITRNGFENTDPIQVDKPVVNETKAEPPVPLHLLLPKPSTDPPIELPDTVTKSVEAITKPMRKKLKENLAANAKGKRNARLISHMARNKPKPPVEPNPIVLSEDSDSEVERFLASEYPYSQGLCAKPSYDFVSNLPPCLKDDPNYPGIELPRETLGHLAKPSPAMSEPTQSPCDQCNLWLERYYIDVPILQSKIQSLEDQIAVLTSQKAKLQAVDKKKKTTSSIMFKNVESATVVVNSKLA